MMTISTEVGLLGIPLHILEEIAKHSVAVDYLHFRATCKRCRLAAPPIQWSTVPALRELQAYSLDSPWLMTFDVGDGMFTFTDPKSSDKYFITTYPDSLGYAQIRCSKFGWLLISSDPMSLLFFNPFTRAIVKLAPLTSAFVPDFSSFIFSKPPTCSDSIVVGLIDTNEEVLIYVTSPGKSEWSSMRIDNNILDNMPFHDNQTFCNGNEIYALGIDGELGGLTIGIDSASWKVLIAKPPTTCRTSPQFFLVECGDDLLLVIGGEFGEYAEVFKLNRCGMHWEKVDDLGSYAIYISNIASFSVIAKTRGMENKIYFSKFNDANNVVFCSLGTDKEKSCEETVADSFSIKENLLSLWIEPSWSS